MESVNTCAFPYDGDVIVDINYELTVEWINISSLQVRGCYGDLFAYALRKFGILCVGVYRFRDSSCSVTLHPCAKRYVITNPPDDFRLMPSDKVREVLGQLNNNASHIHEC